jgi:hypothetical protein
MAATALQEAPMPWSARLASAFRPPELPDISRKAFRFHMAYVLLDSVSSGIISNVPLMAVKALQASDPQLQIPIAMASAGLFASVITGAIMARKRKMPFMLVPGFAGALFMFLMAWTRTPLWFLIAAGFVSVFDFALRPAIPSVLRIVYPGYCQSHVAGTLRQYASFVFPGSVLLFASFLTASGPHIRGMIAFQLSLAGALTVAGLICLSKLPERGDGSLSEAMPETSPNHLNWLRASLAPLSNSAFRRFLGCFFVYTFGNLLFMGVVAPFFARDLGYGYVEATLVIHVIPAITGFLAAGRLTAWFDRTSMFRAYALVALLWGLDPILLALSPSHWPLLVLARMLRGPATVGSIVIAVYTGVQPFAKPGADTTRYIAALYFVNGLSRLIAPQITAQLSGHVSHRAILFAGGFCVVASSICFLVSDPGRKNEGSMTHQFS